jgi:hypothetical protein
MSGFNSRSFGGTFGLIGLSAYGLDERFRHLDMPRRVGAETTEEARVEIETALADSDRRMGEATRFSSELEHERLP